MDYNGKESQPLIKMLLKVDEGLDKLGFESRWNEDGVTCASILDWMPPLRVDHQWLAHGRALELVSTVQTAIAISAQRQSVPLGSRCSIDSAGGLRYFDIVDTVYDDVDAELLDRMITGNMMAIGKAVETLGLAKRPKLT